MSSLSPLKGRNSELSSFSIDYVHVTSEPIDSQVLSSSLVGTPLFAVKSRSPPLNGRAPTLMFLSQLCPVYHLWTDGCSDLFPFYGTQTVMFSSPPLNGRVHNLVLLPLSGPRVLIVKLTQLPLNSVLWAWCLLVGYIQSITSEPTGAQI